MIMNQEIQETMVQQLCKTNEKQLHTKGIKGEDSPPKRELHYVQLLCLG